MCIGKVSREENNGGENVYGRKMCGREISKIRNYSEGEISREGLWRGNI